MDRRELLDDPEEAFRVSFEGAQAGMWTAIPAIVTEVNLAAQTLSAQPAIQGRNEAPDGSLSSVNLPLLVDVPIVWPRGGGFALTFPISVGDEVLIVFSARCIDAWWQSGKINPPAENRMHDLSDGFAILAPTSQPKKLSGVSGSSVQLRNNSGSTFVEIDNSGNVNISANSVNITGNVIINGAMTQSGGPLVTNSVTFATHVHSGVNPGGSNTGPVA